MRGHLVPQVRAQLAITHARMRRCTKPTRCRAPTLATELRRGRLPRVRLGEGGGMITMDCGGGDQRPLSRSSAAAASCPASTLGTAAAAGAPERWRRRSRPRDGATSAATTVRMLPPARRGAAVQLSVFRSLASADARRAPDRLTPPCSRPLAPAKAATAPVRTHQCFLPLCAFRTVSVPASGGLAASGCGSRRPAKRAPRRHPHTAPIVCPPHAGR